MAKVAEVINQIVRVVDCTPHPRNYNQHDPAQIADLRDSLHHFGQVRSIVVQANARNNGHKSWLTVAGHGLIEAAKLEGIDKLRADVIPATWRPARVLAYLAADNELARRGNPDQAQLAALVAEVNDKEGAVLARLAAGEQNALDALLALHRGADGMADAEPQIDRAEELNRKWKVRTGDLWRIGAHRLLCGDSTRREDVERVMQGYKADMVFTDPPYNVASESRNYAADKSKAIQNLKDAEWDHDFDFSAVIPSLDFAMAKDCAVYICTSHWLVQRIWEWMWSWSDFCSYCVWCKPNPMPSLSMRHWTWATELIPYAVRGKHISNFPADGHALNWWNIAKSKETDHPTEKVIEVPMRAIHFSSNVDQIVSDFFAGSGTTLVACQNLQRKCRAIEISPNYCAVILERMATAFPGIEIERIESNDHQHQKTRQRQKAR